MALGEDVAGPVGPPEPGAAPAAAAGDPPPEPPLRVGGPPDRSPRAADQDPVLRGRVGRWGYERTTTLTQPRSSRGLVPRYMVVFDGGARGIAFNGGDPDDEADSDGAALDGF